MESIYRMNILPEQKKYPIIILLSIFLVISCSNKCTCPEDDNPAKQTDFSDLVYQLKFARSVTADPLDIEDLDTLKLSDNPNDSLYIYLSLFDILVGDYSLVFKLNDGAKNRILSGTANLKGGGNGSFSSITYKLLLKSSHKNGEWLSTVDIDDNTVITETLIVVP